MADQITRLFPAEAGRGWDVDSTSQPLLASAICATPQRSSHTTFDDGMNLHDLLIARSIEDPSAVSNGQLATLLDHLSQLLNCLG